MKDTIVQVKGERLRLLVDKALYWPAARTLIIADLHLGKAMHFRKAGIAAPAGVEQENLDRLQRVVQRIRPREVLLLGDLFHSHWNGSWDAFVAVRRMHEGIAFTLITGNHDILHPDVYRRADIGREAQRVSGPFVFTHHPDPHPHQYNVAGHIHPGVRMIGKARQSFTLPCYFFGAAAAILPAFGGFTGVHVLRPTSGDRVFALTKNVVLRCMGPNMDNETR